MGAGNYFYHSPIMGDHISDEYNLMVYVDEYEPDDEDGEYCCNDSILDEVRRLLDERLKGFINADRLPHYCSAVCHDRYNEYFLGEVGRVALIAAPTYYGDRIAIVAAPTAEWQERVDAVEEDPKLTRIREQGHYIAPSIDWAECSPAERAGWASAIRSIRCGGLYREIRAVFNKILALLDEAGFADQMSFRSSAWTSCSYRSPKMAA